MGGGEKEGERRGGKRRRRGANQRRGEEGREGRRRDERRAGRGKVRGRRERWKRGEVERQRDYFYFHAENINTLEEEYLPVLAEKIFKCLGWICEERMCFLPGGNEKQWGENICMCECDCVTVCVCVNPRVDMHTLCLNEVCLGGKWHANMQLTLRGMLTSRPETEADESYGSNSKLYVQFDSLRDYEEKMKVITLRYFCFWSMKITSQRCLRPWKRSTAATEALNLSNIRPVHAQTSTSSSRWRRSSVVNIWTVMMMLSADHTETHH